MRPYQKEVEEKREQSDKGGSKQALLDYYTQLNPTSRLILLCRQTTRCRQTSTKSL